VGAAGMSKKTKQWAIDWRGKITRDVGTDFEEADTMAQAKQQFQSRYPMREIMSVNLTAAS
jgi:hypothetical protein